MGTVDQDAERLGLAARRASHDLDQDAWLVELARWDMVEVLQRDRVRTSFREFCTVGRWAARYGHVSVLVVARGADQVGASRLTPSDTRQSE
jgi:hypothetical protein